MFLQSESPIDLTGWLWLAWVIYWFVASRFVAKTKAKESGLERTKHLAPVLVGMALIFQGHQIPGLSGAGLPATLRWFGVGVASVGLLFSVWARIHLGKYWSAVITLKDGHRLIRTGPYRIVRHPIYTGVIIGGFGSALAAGTLPADLGFILLLGSFVYKIKREEIYLVKEFGPEYAQFRQEVRALIPYVY